MMKSNTDILPVSEESILIKRGFIFTDTSSISQKENGDKHVSF